MIALLDSYSDFVYFPNANSCVMQKVHQFAKSRSCHLGHKGVFAVNGSMFNLFMKPSHYSEMFYNRKSRYLLNCQMDILDFTR